MSKVFYTSDWHMGHPGIHEKFRTQFSSESDHDNTILDNYRKVAGKRDVVYFLGDICFKKYSLDLIKELPGTKRLILGNHENQFKEFSKVDLFDVFETIDGLHKRKGAWLSHAPIHPIELRGKMNIHGHVHNATINDFRYVNVSLENCNYFPVDFAVIKRAYANQQVFTKI